MTSSGPGTLPRGVQCLNCKTENPPANKYCGNCGTPLDGSGGQPDVYLAEQIRKVMIQQYGDRELIEYKVRTDFGRFVVAPLGIILAILGFFGYKTFSDFTDSAKNAINSNAILVHVESATATAKMSGEYKSFKSNIDADLQAVQTETTKAARLNGKIQNVSNQANLLEEVILAQAANALNNYTDQFNSSKLDPKWSWLNGPPQHWSLMAHPGWLRILTEDKEDMSDKKTNAHVLREKALTGDYAITTYIEMLPTQSFQQGGIIMYGNDSNFCKVVYVQHNSYPTIEMGCKGRGGFNYNTHLATLSTRIPGYFLQLDKRGVTYTAYESTNGARWTQVASSRSLKVTPMGAPAWVGLLALNGAKPTVPSIPADFHFFQEQAIPAGATGPLPVSEMNQNK